MHVALTADAVGGVWTYALDLGRGLCARGCAVTLLVLGPSASEAQTAQALEAGLTVVDTGLPLDWLSDDEAAVREAGATLGRQVRAVGADLLHLNHPALGAGYTGAPFIAVAHSCVATWWTAVRGAEPMPDDFRWRTALVAEGYRRAVRVLAPSRAFAEATQAAYGLAHSPEVVWNGRRPSLQAARDGLADQVLAAGRLWDDGKDVATLERAAGRLNAPMFAAGSLAGPNGVAVTLHHMRGLGFLPEAELAARFEARPVFASAAVYEPFGLAPLEAAQAGCALVLSDIPTHRELWDGAALFFSPRDDTALADALSGVLNAPERRAALGAAARERAARYTVDRMVEGTLAAYAAATLEPVA